MLRENPYEVEKVDFDSLILKIYIKKNSIFYKIIFIFTCLKIFLNIRIFL